MRTFNLRFFSLLLASGLVFAAAVYFVHEWQVGRQSRMFVREANRAKERGQTKEAVEWLSRYLSLAPGDDAVAADLGLLFLDLNRNLQAFSLLERVVRRNPERDDLRRKLAALAVTLGRPADALFHLNELEKRFPDDAELGELLAKSQRASGQHKAAADSLKKAVEKKPDQLTSYLELADLYREDLADARQEWDWLEKMVTFNPKSVRALVLRGTYLLNFAGNRRRTKETPADPTNDSAPDLGNAHDAALKDAKDALELASQDIDVQLFAARAFLESARHDPTESSRKALLVESRRLSEACLRRVPNSAEVYSLLAGIEISSGDVKAAIRWLQKGIEALPNEKDLIWNHCRLQIEDARPPSEDAGERKHFEEMLKRMDIMLKRLEELKYPTAPRQYLEARVLITKEEWLLASTLLERVRNQLAAWPELSAQADFWLGLCHKELGNYDQQLAAYRRGVATDPLWLPARRGVAEALLSVGKISESLDEYRVINAHPQASEQDRSKFLKLQILVNLQRSAATRKWDDVNKTLAEIAKALPDSPDAAILRAEVQLAQGKTDDARSTLKEARTRHPNYEDLRLAEIEFELRDKDWDRASTLLDETEKQLGDRFKFRLARARLLIIRKGADAAPELERLAKPPETYSSDNGLRLIAGMAEYALAIREFKIAERLCGQVAARQKSNLRIRLLLFDLAFRDTQLKQMQKLLDDVQEIEGKGPLWHYGEAVRLSVLAQAGKEGQTNLDKSLLEKAKAHLADASAWRPRWSRIPLLAAQICDLEGDADTAIDNYKKAVELGERNPEVVSRLVRLYYDEQRFFDADKVVRELESRNTPFSESLTQLASQVSLQLADGARALDLAERGARNSKSADDHIWLGQVLWSLRRFDEAEKSLQEALRLDAASPNGWAGLITCYARANQVAKADAAIAEARKKIQGNEVSLTIAQCYELLAEAAAAQSKDQEAEQRRAAAEKEYALALESRGKELKVLQRVAEFHLRNGQTEKAEPLLSQMEQSAGSDKEVRWARRNSALIHLSRRSRPELQMAIGLVDKNLQDDKTSLPDQRLKAIALSELSEPGSRRDAIRLFESVVNAAGGDIERAEEERYLLAQLYRAEGRWGDAASQMRVLLAVHSDQPRYVAWYAEALLQRKELSEAEQWVKRLGELAPSEFRTMRLQAQFEFLSGRPDQALRLIVDSARSRKATADAADTLRGAALTLEEFAARLPKSAGEQELNDKYLKEAESLYREYLDLRPAEQLVLAAYYFRQARTAEGLTLLKERAAEAKPEEIALVCSAALPALRGRASDINQLKGILNASLEKHQRPVVLLMTLSDLLGQVDQHAEVEVVLREVLAKDPKNLLALNNLAMLLALKPDKHPDEALTLVGRAIDEAGSRAALVDSRAVVHLSKGAIEKACQDATLAVASEPSGVHLFHQAQAFWRNNQKDKAQKALKAALKAGLKQDDLHPLERAAYRKLRSEAGGEL